MRYCAGEEDTSNGITGGPAPGSGLVQLGWVALAAAAAAAGKTWAARPLCPPWCRGPLPVGDCGVGVCSPPESEGWG
jgi:hypothetical protein